MSFDANHGGHLLDLQEQIHRARTITPGLMADVIARACPGVRAQHRSVKTRILHLIESGAFADATLALLELELPQWKLRRLIYEDGEWHCSLSKHVSLPTELDEMAEANHEDLPLAILYAFVEARRQSLIMAQRQPPSVPQIRAAQSYAVCCDNFA